MPLVKTVLVQYMMNRAPELDALVPTTKRWSRDEIERTEPLHGVYNKRCRPIMKRCLREGRRSPQEALCSLNVRYLPELEAARLDPAFHSFWSINTEDDYSMLQAYGQETKGGS